MSAEGWETEDADIEADPELKATRAKIFDAFMANLGVTDKKVRRGPHVAVVWTDRFGLENEFCVGARKPCYNGDRLWFIGVNGRGARVESEVNDRICPQKHEEPREIGWRRCISVVEEEVLGAADWLGHIAGARGVVVTIPPPPTFIRDKGGWLRVAAPHRGFEDFWTARALIAQWRTSPDGG